MIYLDSCAVIKLLKVENESAALVKWLGDRAGVPKVSSALLEVEMARALHRDAPHLLDDLPQVLARIHRLDMTAEVRSKAAGYRYPQLRSFDALHLATADLLREELHAFVTYDRRLAAYADAAGQSVVAPGE
ncbi:type II toxin-antitoxin system VapC family toxin [Glycomyces paridis]|uniref:Type II toxin-antitoxin system VapC family toxin n=1 Tax=Glycomyces paridis TaxID=2126555 RepID=A0A4S8PC35_9ACTN|nr:type II toxin-antitoxin system VapC family toxin [Glycomyces paridis]THV27271.1 type II toxin-antitoxin system VapC family toxin [Glycomyces paridis]